MRKILVHTATLWSAFILAFFTASAFSQTLSLNDGSILQSNTNRIGINIGAIDYWDQGQILKNLIGSNNPGMEPLQNRQIWALRAAGTTTTFTIPDVYDGVPANYWAGGTFSVVEAQTGGAELGCTGTIASNTGPNYPVAGVTTWVAPTITVSNACNAPFSDGDIVTLTKSTFPTPESWWEGSKGGTWGSVAGGGQLLSDTTDLCATCGTQALTMNASTAGSRATASWYFDGESSDNAFVLINGTYQVSFWAKLVSGTPTLTVSAQRGTTGGFNCGSYAPKLTTTWAQYTWSCTASESASNLVPAAGQVAFNLSGGEAYLDNVSFQKISGNPSNTTVLRDEVIQTLETYYGPAIGNNPGTFRYWVNQNGETIGNWTQPDYAHAPSSGGAGYFVSPGGAGTETLSLQDYLVICQYLNAVPYLEVPVTLTTADAANLVEFLASPSTTTFGARRAAMGQTEPWTSVFSTIHLSFCNECWNSQSFPGQSLGDRPTQPNYEYYYDYSTRTRDIFAAMRADSYYRTSSLDLVMNAQSGVSSTMDLGIQRAHPDSIEIEDYTYGTVNSFGTDAALWQPAMVDPYEKVTNPSDIRNFYQSVHDYQSQRTCGATGTATCKVNIYEWGQGTLAGSIDQTHMDYINAGAGEGAIMALQPLLNMQYYGIRPQSFFALSEYKNGAVNGLIAKLWGNTVDMGGATNSVRPTFIGVQLANQSIIGPMYACPINNNLTYNFPGSSNGDKPMPAMTNVPYLYAFCFENGTKRSLVLINTDLTTSHTLNFGGTNPPSGTVTVRQYAPSDLDEMNEAPTGTRTNLVQATSALETSTLSSPTSITLPPFSATALDYTTLGQTAAGMPSFSPAAGIYTTSQSVSISGTTAGTTIYYTTDGTSPTTSSSVYSNPIAVTGAETIQAIAIASGYANSSIASAAYAIAPMLPAPTFNIAAGTYSTTQSVGISDAQAGTTIYFTTNGSIPTTSSSVYSAPVSVSATETLKAIAVKTGYTNSPAAAATYTFVQTLAVPTFSPAGGSYPNAMAVTISSPSAGTTIYYTSNGTSPTTSSSVYSGPVTVGVSETLTAIAVKAGSANSTAGAATYTINVAVPPVLPAPKFSLAGGTYTTAQTVTISDATAGTTIYYTTNGTTPTTSSLKYAGAIAVSASETLEAIAVESGYSDSPVVTSTFTLNTVNTLYIDYPSNGFTSSALSLNYGASVTAGVLQLTDGSRGEIRSAWNRTKVPISAFTTDFTFQLKHALADGFTFTIQNAPKGIWTLGNGGGGLSYQGIQKSVAVKFDIYNDTGEGTDSTGVYTNGAAATMPSTDMTSSGVILRSGDLMHAHLIYDGSTLTLTLTDTVTGAVFTKAFTVNIPSIVGGTTAYVGFTGSTGSNVATQQITSWTYATP